MGIRYNDGAPVADFEADMTLIPEGCAIDFTQLSSGPPQTFAWTFEGGVPVSSTDETRRILFIMKLVFMMLL